MDENILALPQGTELNHYIIESVLGQGGFGVVYKATHAHLNEDVVIKEFLPVELASRHGQTVTPHGTSKQDLYGDCLHRFMEEGRTLVKLRHQNVVRCRDLFTANGTAYLVMDFEDGLALDELIKSLEAQGQQYTQAQLMHFLVPLADGLAYIHDEGVLHRDIKPGNVFIRRSDGSPVLIDFGAAKQNFAVASQSQAPYTEFYAPMEQIEGGGEAKPTIDIHAFGALMYRIVTGTVGAKSESRVLAMATGKNDPLAPAASLAKGQYSDDFLSLIDDCLKFKPELRPQSMSEVRMRLLNGETAAKVVPDTAQQSLALLDDLINMAGSDSVISDSEMKLILTKAQSENIDATAAQNYVISKATENNWQIGDAVTAEDPHKVVESSSGKDKVENNKKPESPYLHVPKRNVEENQDNEASQGKKKRTLGQKLFIVFVFISICVGFVRIVNYQKEQDNKRLVAEVIERQKQREEANKRADYNAWTRAKSINTEVAYQAYLSAQPNGQYRQLAQNAITELKRLQQQAQQQQTNKRADDAAWAAAKKGNTAMDYDKYLSDNPSGSYRQAAANALNELANKGQNPTDDNEQFTRGYNYAYGKEGLKQSYAQAIYWYQKAAAQGNSGAMNNLGLLHSRGDGVKQSYSEAAKWYRKASDLGDAIAANNLGSLYRDGDGVPQSHAEANKLFRKSIDLKHYGAYVNLGFQYHRGNGVTKSYTEAVKYYRIAAEQGEKYGQLNLGVMYENGHGVTKSESEAIKWYRLAAKQGVESAQKALERRNLTW